MLMAVSNKKNSFKLASVMQNINFFFTCLFVAPAFAADFPNLPTPHSGKSFIEYFKDKTEAQINDDCQNGRGGTLGLSFCAKRDFEKADNKLRSLYAQEYQNVLKNDRDLKVKDLRVAAPHFASAQKAWIKYRDDRCVAAYLSIGNASMRNITYSDCLTKMTNNRIKELSEHSDE